MGDHDCISLLPEAEDGAYVGRCRCGHVSVGEDQAEAYEAHGRHFSAQVGLAGVEQARRVLDAVTSGDAGAADESADGPGNGEQARAALEGGRDA